MRTVKGTMEAENLRADKTCTDSGVMSESALILSSMRAVMSFQDKTVKGKGETGRRVKPAR